MGTMPIDLENTSILEPKLVGPLSKGEVEQPVKEGMRTPKK